jgi:hypothetical protein
MSTMTDADFQAWLVRTYADMADHMINTGNNQACQHGVA